MMAGNKHMIADLAGVGVLAGLMMIGVLAGCTPNPTPSDDASDADVRKVRSDDSPTSSKTGGSMNPEISKSGYDVTPLSRERVAELAKKLSPEAYKITQSADTERPFCGTLLDNKKDGMYTCVVCGLPLFSSESKFHSGTGWPSFYQEFDPEHVARKTDVSHGMARTEINCARCGAHLGHVFDDGPKPTGERHCLNSASLKFFEKGEKRPPESMPLAASRASGDSSGAGPSSQSMTQPSTTETKTMQTETAYFAAGCFWGVEHYFQKGPGVIDAASGYMQGRTDNPTYKDVCNDTTGHAETVKVVFDPKKISYRRLLEAFFKMHDPTQLNRQGPDVGDQYRSGIWTTNAEQKRDAEAYIKELTEAKRFGGRKIVTQVEPAKKFYPAEEYHQDYIDKTGRACHVTNPW